MVISKQNFWYGDFPSDIREYLESYCQDGYGMNVFRLAKCPCGSETFYIFFDDREGVAKRVCVDCSEENFVCDSEEFWDEAEPEKLSCPECGSFKGNLGAGFSLYEDQKAIRWIYLGNRCAKCGVLGCFSEWKVGYEPSLFLIEKV